MGAASLLVHSHPRREVLGGPSWSWKGSLGKRFTAYSPGFDFHATPLRLPAQSFNFEGSKAVSVLAYLTRFPFSFYF